jgi:tetratricopeptide (TPR) repeat protein
VPDPISETSVLVVLGDEREAAGDLSAARDAFREAAALLDEPIGGEDHERVRLWCEIQTRLGQLEGATGDLAGADARLSGVLARAGAALGPTDETVIAALVALGTIHRVAGRLDDADAAYQQALSILQEEPGPHPADIRQLRDHLAQLVKFRYPPDS